MSQEKPSRRETKGPPPKIRKGKRQKADRTAEKADSSLDTSQLILLVLFGLLMAGLATVLYASWSAAAKEKAPPKAATAAQPVEAAPASNANGDAH